MVTFPKLSYKNSVQMFYYIPQILYDLYNSHENYTNIANKLACLLEVVRRSDKDSFFAPMFCDFRDDFEDRSQKHKL